MKHLLSIVLILTLSFQGISQKKKTKKKSKPKTAVVTSDIAVEDMYVTEEIVIDTLRISQGKRYVLLVDVDKYSGQSEVTYTFAERTEKTELIENFGKENLEVITINKYTYVVFENKQTLDISGEGQSYQAFAYWSGKIKDDVQVKEGTKMATEFVAEQMGVKKESSYVINTKKYKKEVASLQKKNKITSKSREVMNALLSSYALPITEVQLEDIPVYQQSNAKIKTIESYLFKKGGTKTLLKSIYLDEKGLPTAISYYDRDGGAKSKKDYVYKDGMLVQIKKGDEVTLSINYDDNKMIFTGNVGDANETRIVWLENGKLLVKSYTLMIDDKYSYMNTLVEEKIEDNCVSYSINNVRWSINCSSQANIFPFIHKYTSFQNGDILQFTKSKIEKKGEKTFEKYYSSAEREEQNDIFKLWGTFQLNDQNLVSTYSFSKDNKKEVIKIDYTYYE
ncbi:hypothetical protein [Flavobacterium sp. PS2]|uniref:hypothetical protein n=1 Tax=Flavobacterium sp. PS2 TaxID=3384157 RepID=UPI00390C8D14